MQLKKLFIAFAILLSLSMNALLNLGGITAEYSIIYLIDVISRTMSAHYVCAKVFLIIINNYKHFNKSRLKSIYIFRLQNTNIFLICRKK